MEETLRDYYLARIKEMDSLIIYKQIIENPIINAVKTYMKGVVNYDDNSDVNETLSNIASRFLFEAEKSCLCGNIFKKFVLKLCLKDENIYSLTCEKGGVNPHSGLYKLASREMETLLSIVNIDVSTIFQNKELSDILISYIPAALYQNKNDDLIDFIDQIETENTASQLQENLTMYYSSFGCGYMGRYAMFKYTSKKGIIPIKNYDRIELSDIIGYDRQKEILINNTKAFLSGLPANNALLAGARGTGKSSVVKAIVNNFFGDGLRLLEINKDQLSDLQSILDTLRKRGKYFIIFLDDLSFDEFDRDYKHLKSLLEGTAEVRPRNVLFYATSNRRHIIQENWADKDGTQIKDGEIHSSDTVNEKLSLSDRFGLTVYFPKPSPQEYINIVEGIAKKEGIELTQNFLQEEAMKWELNQTGLSGRTARQYVNELIYEVNKKD